MEGPTYFRGAAILSAVHANMTAEELQQVMNESNNEVKGMHEARTTDPLL
jgi:hypothetical protein